MLRDRYFGRLAAFFGARSAYPLAWQEATGASQWLLHLTPDELRSVNERVTAMLEGYFDRNLNASQRPAGSLPVEVLLSAYPVRPPVA